MNSLLTAPACRPGSVPSKTSSSTKSGADWPNFLVASKVCSALFSVWSIHQTPRCRCSNRSRLRFEYKIFYIACLWKPSIYHLPPLVDSRCRPRNRLVTITKQIMQSFKACSSRMHEKGLDLERAVKKPIENPGCLSVSEDPEYWRHTVLIQISMNHFWNHPLKYFQYSIDFRHTCRCPRELNILAFTLKLCSHFHLHSS